MDYTMYKSRENIHQNIWRYMLKFIRMHIGLLANISFHKGFISAMGKHPKRLTVVTTRKRIG